MSAASSTTWLDFIPTEIIFHIFEYLSNNDIIYTFFYLNQRFNSLLLQNQQYLTYLELPTTNFTSWKQILSVIGSQIEVLNVIVSSFPLTLFPNMKSIIISSPYSLSDEHLKSIFECEQFNNLHSIKKKKQNSFNEINNNYLWDQDFVLKNVFNNNNSLKIFQYPLITPRFSVGDARSFEISLTLHSLTLNLTHFHDIFSLLGYTPNLKYLNVQSPPPDYGRRTIYERSNKLEQFHLKLIPKKPISYGRNLQYIDSEYLILSIKQFSSSLTCLSLNLFDLDIETTAEFPLNSLKLQQFLQVMVELKQFHLYAKFITHFSSPESIVSRFQNQFWFDHNWSFGIHGKYFYTLPFHFDYLDEVNSLDDIKSNNPMIFKTNPRIWHKVKTIDLSITSMYDLNFIKDLKMKMPRLTKIELHGCTPDPPDDIQNYNERDDIGLNSVTVLDLIRCPSEMKKYLFVYVLPNVKHLIFSPGKLPLVESQLTSILNKRIEKLSIDMNCDLERFVIASDIYFSNVQHIYFDFSAMYSKTHLWYKVNIMKILTDFKSLKTLTIYMRRMFDQTRGPSIETHLEDLISYLTINGIMENYVVEHYRKFSVFSKKY